MNIPDPSSLTGPQLREIREAKALSQAAFWGAIGVKQPAGHGYENDREMPESVRRLVYLHYVVGIPTDAEPSVLAAVGQAATAAHQARRDLRRAETLATSAVSKIMEARQVLGAGAK